MSILSIVVPIFMISLFIILVITIIFLFGCLIFDSDPIEVIWYLKKLIKTSKRIFTNLKQHKMNYKALGRAMGFMFLPTLGVLTVLLVGFFDPVAMWTFIKSNDGWAVFTRVVLLIAEVTLIVIMYFIYNKEDVIKKLLNATESDDIVCQKVNSNDSTCSLFRGNSRDEYIKYSTKNKNIIAVERRPRPEQESGY